MLSGSLAGASMGLQFNVIAATVTAVIAAAVAGYPRAPRARGWWFAGVLIVGWVLGDGVALAGAVGTGPAATAYGAAWALVGFALGYLAPALIGAAVGRTVFRGTGWLTAGAVAFAVTPTFYALSQRIAPALWSVSR